MSDWKSPDSYNVPLSHESCPINNFPEWYIFSFYVKIHPGLQPHGSLICQMLSTERPISEQERPYQILEQWGIHREEVKFYLRHYPPGPPQVVDGMYL